MKTNECEFDFYAPAGYRIKDGIKNVFRKKEKAPNDEFEKMVYFKTEVVKQGIFTFKYLICYENGKFINPMDTFSKKQLLDMIAKEKGYIGYKEVQSEYGLKKGYVIQHLDRAHSYPSSFNIDYLADNNLALCLN